MSGWGGLSAGAAGQAGREEAEVAESGSHRMESLDALLDLELDLNSVVVNHP